MTLTEQLAQNPEIAEAIEKAMAMPLAYHDADCEQRAGAPCACHRRHQSQAILAAVVVGYAAGLTRMGCHVWEKYPQAVECRDAVDVAYRNAGNRLPVERWCTRCRLLAEIEAEGSSPEIPDSSAQREEA